MARKVAFCLVENSSGQVLLIQRAYGKEKYKWSLPGGFVDRGERSARAAEREAREETGLRVKAVSTIMEGRRHPLKTFYGVIRGGRLKKQPKECLDVRFFDYDHLPPLAFSADQRAIDIWQKMKANHRKLASLPPPSACPYCDCTAISIRKYPHRTNLYRCQSCESTLESATRPWKILRSGSSDSSTKGWQHVGRICTITGSDMSRVPQWVSDFVATPDVMRTALYKGGFWQLVGRNYRYALVPSGQGVSRIDFYRKKRPFIAQDSQDEDESLSVSQLEGSSETGWQDVFEELQ